MIEFIVVESGKPHSEDLDPGLNKTEKAISTQAFITLFLLTANAG